MTGKKNRIGSAAGLVGLLAGLVGVLLPGLLMAQDVFFDRPANQLVLVKPMGSPIRSRRSRSCGAIRTFTCSFAILFAITSMVTESYHIVQEK